MKNITQLFSQIESTTKSSEKEQIFANFFANNEDKHEVYMKIIADEIIPRPEKLDAGKAKMITAISHETGFSIKEIKKMATQKEFGCTSDIAKYCFEHKKSTGLFDFGKPKIALSIEAIVDNLANIANVNTDDEKISLIKSCFTGQTSESIRFISHIILRDLPLGYKDPVIIKAISNYRNIPKKDIERAFIFSNSMVKVLTVDIEDLQFRLGKPFPVMLAKLSDEKDISIGKIMDIKLDGNRAVGNVIENEDITIYSRNLHDQTESFPDIVKFLNEFKELNKDKLPIVLDGEIVSGDKFSDSAKRTRRKYDVAEYAEKYPAIFYVFDIIYCGVPLYDTPLIERRNILDTLNFPEGIVPVETLFIESMEHFNEYYENALEDGFEGVMVKDPKSIYDFGKKTAKWTKKKPSDTADVIVYDGNYGKNKYAGMYSSLQIMTGDGHKIGSCGSGLTAEDVIIVTEKINNGEKFMIKIDFEAIEKSPTSESGYTLRFSRFKDYVTYKPLQQATTLDELFKISKLV
jgi:DNA ligase-1